MKAKSALVAAVASVGIATTTQAATLFVDLSSFNTWGGYPNAANSTTVVNIGAGSTITNISWTNIVVNSLGNSWSSEFAIGVGDGTTYGPTYWESDLPGSPNTPGMFGPVNAAFDNPGLYASTEGFSTATGNLFIYSYELFDDGGSGVQDADVVSGGITIEYTPVPAPGALALFGMAGMLGSRRRRAG